MSNIENMKFTEIEVLGTNTQDEGMAPLVPSPEKPHNGGGHWMWIMLALILIAALFFMYQYFSASSSSEAEPPVEEVLFCREVVPETSSIEESLLPSGVFCSEESVNDVPMTIYSLQNLDAELVMGKPDISDTAIVFVLQAADIRKDNSEIVGDFVIKGKQLTKGKRKPGYCAIVNNRISIGMSGTNEVMNYCMDKKGDYFRQYMLVYDAEAQINKLRGKSLRRALANNGDSLYIVMTHNRESLYDFSLALQDIGMTNALYLVGGSSYYAYRNATDTTANKHGMDMNDSPHMNYLVFRKRK